MESTKRFFEHLDLHPLAAAIASKRAVAVVGAGASAASGLPLWDDLLEQCLTFAKQTGRPVQQAEARLRQYDHLLAAELLERTLGIDNLHTFFTEVLRSRGVRHPSTIHRAIARLPFRVAITTNFDHLLEEAYEPHERPLTWKQSDDVFKNIREGTFFVLKSHGDLSERASLVLTRSHFRDHIHRSDRYLEGMRSLLINCTVLFVGHSLRDLDLLHMMDELRLRFGLCFGPHYAILCEAEVDSSVESHLQESYNIKVLTFPQHEYPHLEQSVSMTRSVTDLLTEISGRVAHIQARGGMTIRVEPRYTLSRTCDDILDQARVVLGAPDGLICLTLQKSVRRLQYVALRGSYSQADAGKDVNPQSDLGSLFLRRRSEGDWINNPDLLSCSPSSFAFDQPNTRFAANRSRLAAPIYCDGHREGIISVESPLPHAFTSLHVQAITKFAQLVGMALYEARQRALTTELMQSYTKNLDGFLDLLRTSRIFNDVDIRVILYKLRYLEGEMLALSKEAIDEKPFTHKFDSDSLAARVLECKSPEQIDDADEELRRSPSRLSERGVIHFNIHGPVVAVPVRAHGYTASVVVAWPGKADRRVWKYVPERLQRMVNLIGNDPSLWDRSSRLTVRGLLDKINSELLPIDNGKIWSKSLVRTQYKALVRALLKALIEDAGIARVRLWRRVERDSTFLSGRELFVCTDSGSLRDGRRPEWDSHFGKASWDDDHCTDYTIQRYDHDPYARTQHRKMFGDLPDPNCEFIGKDPDGYWIVAPIVGNAWATGPRRKTLLGFVSADNHYFDEKLNGWKETEMMPQVRSFQRSALDLVTDLLHLIYSEPIRLTDDLRLRLLTRGGPAFPTENHR